MLDLIVFTSFIIILVILFKEKFDLLSPNFWLPLLIGLYSYYSIKMAIVAGELDFVVYSEVLSKGVIYGFLCLIAYITGSLFSKSFLKKKSVFHSPIIYSKKVIFIYLLIGLCGGFLIMKVQAGSVSNFVNNLHLRQEFASGNSSIIFLLFPAKVAMFLYLDSIWKRNHGQNGVSKMEWLLFLSLLALVLFWLSLLGGRLFSLMMIIQLLVIYSVFEKNVKKVFAISGIVSFFIFFVYGLYRFGQNKMQEGLVNSEIDFLFYAFENPEVIMQVLVTIFFDGWYVLLEYMRVVDQEMYTGFGVITLSALAKLVPGLFSYINNEFISLTDAISSASYMQYRAKSFLAQAYADFNMFGFILFFILGVIVNYLGKPLVAVNNISLRYKNEALPLIMSVYIYSILFVNSLVLIRSGIHVAFTWIVVECFWLFILILISSKGKLVFRKVW